MPRLSTLSATTAMLVAFAVPAGASTSIYTDRTAWESALSAQFLLEDFSDAQLNPGVSFVSSESGHINPALENYQDVLASESQNEPMTTWSFADGITAYGGNWTLGGPGGSGNNLAVYLDAAYVGSISNGHGGEFWGFVSSSTFGSVKLVGGSGIHQQHYSLDNMVYAPVPEPAAAWMLFAGLATLFGLGRKSRP